MVRLTRPMPATSPSASGAPMPATPPRLRTAAVRLLPLLSLACLALLAAAAPATASIYDPAAEPSNQYFVDGGVGLHDYALDVAVTRDAVWACGRGTYAGTDTDATLTRVGRADGTLVTRHYDGPLHGFDSFDCLAPGPGGVIYTAGTASSATGFDVLLVKWSATGTRLWARRYDGPAHGSDWATDVAVDRSGNVVVCASSESATDADWAVLSWRPDGRRRWVWRMNGAGDGSDRPWDLLVDRSGTTYVAGEVTASGPTRALGCARLGADGRVLWKRTWRGPDELGAAAQALDADPRGGVVLAGAAATPANGDDALVVAYTATGARRWYRTYRLTSGTQADRFLDVAVTTAGKVALAGDVTAGSSADPLWALYTLEGDFRQATLSSTPTDDRFNAVAADAWGGHVLVGSMQSTSIASSTGCWVERIPADHGGLYWLYRSTPLTAGTLDRASAVATRGGVVAVAGAVWNGPSLGYDQAILVWAY